MSSEDKSKKTRRSRRSIFASGNAPEYGSDILPPPAPSDVTNTDKAAVEPNAAANTFHGSSDIKKGKEAIADPLGDAESHADKIARLEAELAKVNLSHDRLQKELAGTNEIKTSLARRIEGINKILQHPDIPFRTSVIDMIIGETQEEFCTKDMIKGDVDMDKAAKAQAYAFLDNVMADQPTHPDEDEMSYPQLMADYEELKNEYFSLARVIVCGAKISECWGKGPRARSITNLMMATVREKALEGVLRGDNEVGYEAREELWAFAEPYGRPAGWRVPQPDKEDQEEGEDDVEKGEEGKEDGGTGCGSEKGDENA